LERHAWRRRPPKGKTTIQAYICLGSYPPKPPPGSGPNVKSKSYTGIFEKALASASGIYGFQE